MFVVSLVAHIWCYFQLEKLVKAMFRQRRGQSRGIFAPGSQACRRFVFCAHNRKLNSHPSSPSLKSTMGINFVNTSNGLFPQSFFI